MLLSKRNTKKNKPKIITEKMKKLLLTLLVSMPIISFAQGIPFKATSNLELVWSKEYDGELDITSSQINLNNTDKGVQYT